MCFKDDCNEGATGRRSFLLSATASLTGFAAARAQQSASPQAGQPETRVLDDARVQHGKVVFKHNGADSIDGFLARPKAEGVYPAVLVIAGNKINEEYIPNTCAALALAGFVGLAPNIFHPLPGDTPINAEPYDKYIANHTDLDKLDDVQAGASYLRAQRFVRAGAMGVLGFCSGGRLALMHGARSRDVDAVVAFHPAPMKEGEFARLKVPVQIHHGTDDHAVAFAESVKLEKNLKAQRTPVELFTYAGADHGFLAYTRPFYKPGYAKLAWSRATQFLHKQLG
jgi:carboxymethylenebutenolidase